MQIGISTACFYPYPLENTFSKIADMGFKKIEIFFNTESEVKEPFLTEIYNAVKEYALEVISVHPYTSLMEGMLLFSNYERRTKDGFEQYKRYFEAAQKLGAKYLTFHGEKETGTTDNQEVWQRKVKSYKNLCKLADEHSVIVAQENVAWCKSANPLYLKKLYNDVPELCYTFDLKQARRAGYEWLEYYNIIKNRLKNIHINDFNEEKSCLLPGKGVFDYNKLFDMLKKDGYLGDALIEVYTSDYSDYSELLNAAEFLEKYIKS